MARLGNNINGSDLRNLYLKWFRPFEISIEEAIENCVVSERTEEVAEMDGVTTPSLGPNANGLDTPSDGEMEFFITDEKGTVKNSKILMHEPLAINGELRLLHVLACWSEKDIKRYDTQLCSSLPEVFKSNFLAKRPQESVSLYKCLEAFLQEEPLGPEDMWLVTIYIFIIKRKSTLIGMRITPSFRCTWAQHLYIQLNCYDVHCYHPYFHNHLYIWL